MSAHSSFVRFVSPERRGGGVVQAPMALYFVSVIACPPLYLQGYLCPFHPYLEATCPISKAFFLIFSLWSTGFENDSLDAYLSLFFPVFLYIMVLRTDGRWWLLCHSGAKGHTPQHTPRTTPLPHPRFKAFFAFLPSPTFVSTDPSFDRIPLFDTWCILQRFTCAWIRVLVALVLV